MVFLFAISGTAFVFGQNPVANFTANQRSGCAPLTVRFNDASTGSPTNWNWEFSNGTLSSAQNPGVTFSTPGVYSVKLVVRNANGIDQIERVDYITVYPSPTANFNANITLGCVPVQVSFTDLSTSSDGSIVAWEWDFGDGTSSNQKNPTHNYANTGFYTVSLTVTSNNGCKRTVTRARYIRVVDGVSTNFTYDFARSCRAPIGVNFRNQSSGPGNISYTWNFGNGQTSTTRNPSTIYNTPGTYTVRLNAQSDFGCSGSIEKQITITETNTDFTGPDYACIGQPVGFQNASSATPEASFWNFDDGTTSAQTNPVKTFLAAGTYNVKMINFFSTCVDSVTKTVIVEDKPQTDFTTDDSSSCKVPFNVQFTDLTPGATSWLWTFGDGTTSTERNPQHSFNDFGEFSVTLTTNTSAGCQNTITKPNLIKIKETTVSINAPRGGCVPFSYTPVATIFTMDSIASYLWDFGDGTTSTLANPPAHVYNSTGQYTLSLTVTTESGCVITKTIPQGILVGTPPTVSFTATPLDQCASQRISFTGQAITTPGADVKWHWEFGDGRSSSVQNPTHKFRDFGDLDVTLTVTNNGCERSVTQTLRVKPPVAEFKYFIGCDDRSVTFNNTSKIDNTLTPLTYRWNMGDPANTEFNTFQPPAGFTYPAAGTYNVRLIVENGECSDTITSPVTIIPVQVADFTVSKNEICKNETFTLQATGSDPALVKSYTWTIGAETFASSGRTLSHQIAATGRYNVSLTIEDTDGCITTRTIADFIEITGPEARFAPVTTGACQDQTVTFNDQSTPYSANIVSWEWDFGDGTRQTFSAAPFTHVYGKSGRFNVTLKVTDVSGCTDTYRLPTELLVTNPVAGFRADTFYCPGAQLPFVDTSSGAGLSYFWEFGDGGTSTMQHPSHSYPTGDATYSVKLKIRDISGCEDSVTKVDYITIRSPKAAFDIRDTTTICPPLRTSFTFRGSDYQSFYWDFGDGGSNSLQNPTYFYSDYGHFIPKLYVLGPGGCIDSAQASVSVYNPLASAGVTYGPVTSECNSLNVDFVVTVPPAFKFTLFFGDGSADSSQQKTLSHFYSRPSFNTPRLVIYDTISGCEVAINGSPRINVYGAIPLFGKDKKEFCDAGVVTFRNFTTKNDPIVSTLWDFGDGNTSFDESPSHNFTQPGLYPVTLSVITERGCPSSFRDTVLVYRTPSPLIQSLDTICLNTTQQFDGLLAVSDSLTTWQWNFANGQTAGGQNNTTSFANPGDYTVQLTATNKINCSAVATKSIHVPMLPTATPVQSPITIPVGTGTNLAMTYTGNIISYNWLPTTRLSCTTCPTPFANPQYDTKYTVQVEDRYGCTNSGEITVIVVCGKENISIPNTFSPNGDGRNDVFYPKGTGLYRIKSMRVFNRWGEIVYEKNEFSANDASAGWNGTYKGRPASPDNYIYTMEILCENNAIIPVKGNVTLLR